MKMKNSITIALLTILALSCGQPITTSGELLTAHKEATSTEPWDGLRTKKTDYIEQRFIGEKEVYSQRNIEWTDYQGNLYREVYENDSLNKIFVFDGKQMTQVDFQGDAVKGFMKLSDPPLYKSIIDPLMEKEQLQLKDSIYNQQAVLVLKDGTSKYIFDKESLYLMAMISPDRYGTSYTTYTDYREVEGYTFPFEIDFRIPTAGFRISQKFNSIEVNEPMDADKFKIKEEWLAISEGSMLPEFSIPYVSDLDDSFKKSDIKGKVTLIDFWATWCKPCIEEFPNIKENYEVYKAKGFDVISISIDENFEQLKAYSSKKPFPWDTSLYLEDGFNSQVAKDFQLIGIPKPILVDENGIIIAMDSDIRGDKLEHVLKDLFQDERN
ncbi:MAG: hypothetical protein Tsb004_15450 [Allomuricauda sp.]